MLLLKAYDPVIVFAFSKRECEALALSTSKLSFTSPEEAETVKSVFTNAMSSLSEADQTLPQVTNILPGTFPTCDVSPFCVTETKEISG